MLRSCFIFLCDLKRARAVYEFKVCESLQLLITDICDKACNSSVGPTISLLSNFALKNTFRRFDLRELPDPESKWFADWSWKNSLNIEWVWKFAFSPSVPPAGTGWLCTLSKINFHSRVKITAYMYVLPTARNAYPSESGCCDTSRGWEACGWVLCQGYWRHKL